MSRQHKHSHFSTCKLDPGFVLLAKVRPWYKTRLKSFQKGKILVRNCDIDFFIFGHCFCIMRLKFLTFERDRNAAENFWNGNNESKKIWNSRKVDEIIVKYCLLLLNFVNFHEFLLNFVKDHEILLNFVNFFEILLTYSRKLWLFIISWSVRTWQALLA